MNILSSWQSYENKDNIYYKVVSRVYMYIQYLIYLYLGIKLVPLSPIPDMRPISFLAAHKNPCTPTL